MDEHSPWASTSPVASLVSTAGTVTAVEGASFCISDRAGDIHPERPEGLFVADTRVLSRWQLRVDTGVLEPLAADHEAPFQTTFVGRVHPDGDKADSDLLVLRRRDIGDGMREEITVENHGLEAHALTVTIDVDADHADIFSVKESRVGHEPRGEVEVVAGELELRHSFDGTTAITRVVPSQGAQIGPDRVEWALSLAAKESCALCVEVHAEIGGEQIPPRFRCGGSDGAAEPVERYERWSRSAPVLDTDDAVLGQAVDQAIRDLGALRIFDPSHPGSPVVAAGAPWFMTLFGRDSLLSSWMALIADPSLAQGVLETLARHQGREVDDGTEEEPGKILHEMRFGRARGLMLGGGSVYYGSVDATPLFVMLLGELRRWRLGDDVVRRLLPAADRALTWIEEFGDRDGDGYVEYERRNPRGLANQGWKDSWDGISFADGTLPRPPVALCEVQGYTYAAYLARAYFALEAGDTATFDRYRHKAAQLKEAFNRDFWIPERGWYAVGLDADKRPIDALASNMGHCLWTGIVDDSHAAAVAEHLVSDELFSGWGVRTLAVGMARYNPISYHNGSVWPHDTALAAAGLMRYGFVDHSRTLVSALLDASAANGGRLPELYAGLRRDQLPTPAAYPSSCSPQAWAAASPLLLLRSLLRFDPWVRRGRIHIAPVPRPGTTRLVLTGVTVDDHHLDVRWHAHGFETTGLGELRHDPHPRPPLSAALQPEP